MEKQKIMFDSPEAAKLKSLSGWVADGRFFGDNEDLARYAGCTHKICECGNEMVKHYTKCEPCRIKSARERFLSLPFAAWDGIVPLCIPGGDQYFFDSSEIDDYISDQKQSDEEFPDEIDLLICEPVPLRVIDFEHWSDDMHEDWEPSDELIAAVNALNKVIEAQPTQTWLPGKIRTSYLYEG